MRPSLSFTSPPLRSLPLALPLHPKCMEDSWAPQDISRPPARWQKGCLRQFPSRRLPAMFLSVRLPATAPGVWGMILSSPHTSTQKDHYGLLRLFSHSLAHNSTCRGVTSAQPPSAHPTDLPPTPHSCPITLKSLGHRFYSFISAYSRCLGICGFWKILLGFTCCGYLRPPDHSSQS